MAARNHDVTLGCSDLPALVADAVVEELRLVRHVFLQKASAKLAAWKLPLTRRTAQLLAAPTWQQLGQVRLSLCRRPLGTSSTDSQHQQRVLFFGSDEFSVVSFQQLLQAHRSNSARFISELQASTLRHTGSFTFQRGSSSIKEEVATLGFSLLTFSWLQLVVPPFAETRRRKKTELPIELVAAREHIPVSEAPHEAEGWDQWVKVRFIRWCHNNDGH